MGLGALFVSGLAAQAQADEQRLTLTPSVTVSQNFDREDVGSIDPANGQPGISGGEENNGFFEVAPAFRARAERPGTRLDVDVSTRLRGSSAQSELRGLDETGKLAFSQSIGRRFVAFANGSFRNRDKQDPLDRDATELQNGRPDLHEVTGDFTLAYSVTATSQVSLGYSAFARDYQGRFSNANSNRDVETGAWTLGYSQTMSPLDRLGLSLSYQRLSFGSVDAGGGLRVKDQDDQVTALTASWTRVLSPMWTADVRAGVRRLETDGGGFAGLTSGIGDAGPDDESTGFIGGIAFTRETEWNRTRIGYSRETRPQGGQGTSLDVDAFELSFNQQLLRNLSLQLRGDYQISKSASDSFVPTLAPLGFSDTGFGFDPTCANGAAGIPGMFEGAAFPVCIAQTSQTVDTTVLRLNAELSWRWTRRFVTFLSYDFRDQDVEGIIGGRDRDTSRVRLGFRYAYDYEVY